MPDFYLDLIEEETMQDQSDTAAPAAETLHAQHGTPHAPTTATRKKRADAGSTRENIYVYPSPAMRLDLQHADARDILSAWITGQIIEPEAAKRVSSVIGELMAHIDRLRKNQK